MFHLKGAYTYYVSKESGWVGYAKWNLILQGGWMVHDKCLQKENAKSISSKADTCLYLVIYMNIRIYYDAFRKQKHPKEVIR